MTGEGVSREALSEGGLKKEREGGTGESAVWEEQLRRG